MSRKKLFYENFERICKAQGTSPYAATQEVVLDGKPLGKSSAANWKAHGTIPKQDVLDALAKVLSCRVSDFFKEDDEIREQIEARARLDEIVPEGSIDINDDIRDFMAIYRACTNRQRNMLMSSIYDFEQKVLNA